MSSQFTLVDHADLKRFMSNVFVAVGVPESDAETAARLMAQADLIGQDGHGAFRLPQYVKRIKAGGMNPNPKFRTIEDRAATALIDGDNGLGHLVMHHATEIAMKKAETTGVAWVGARFSNHAGPASLYAMMPAQRDMIGKTP